MPGKLISLQPLSKPDKSHSLYSIIRQEERHFSSPQSFPKPGRKTWLTCIIKSSYERYLNYLGWWFWRRVSIKAEMNRKVLVENLWWNQGEACMHPSLFSDEFWDSLCGHFVILPWLTLSGGLNLLTAIRPGREIWTPLWGRRGWRMERNLWPAAEGRYFVDSWMMSSKAARGWSVYMSTLKSEPVSAVTMEPSPGWGLFLTVPWAQKWIPSCSVFSTVSYRWKLRSTPEGCKKE